MAKLTAWIVTIIGVLLVLPLIGVNALVGVTSWAIAVGVLAVGIGKLMRNYAKKGRR